MQTTETPAKRWTPPPLAFFIPVFCWPFFSGWLNRQHALGMFARIASMALLSAVTYALMFVVVRRIGRDRPWRPPSEWSIGLQFVGLAVGCALAEVAAHAIFPR